MLPWLGRPTVLAFFIRLGATLQLRFPVLTFGDRNAPEIYAKLRLENNVGTDACLT